MDHADTYHFNASLPATGTWPMPPTISAFGGEVLAVLLNNAAAASPTFTELEHVITTFDFGTSGLGCMQCVLSELVNRRFEIPFEGAPHSVQMITEAYLNDSRLRYVLGDEYAAYLRSVETPEVPRLAAPAGAQFLLLAPEDRRQIVSALQFAHEIQTVASNFAAIEAARTGVDVAKVDSIGLAQVRQALKLLRAAPGGQGY
jgi:hypothetical protein